MARSGRGMREGTSWGCRGARRAPCHREQVRALTGASRGRVGAPLGSPRTSSMRRGADRGGATGDGSRAGYRTCVMVRSSEPGPWSRARSPCGARPTRAAAWQRPAGVPSARRWARRGRGVLDRDRAGRRLDGIERAPGRRIRYEEADGDTGAINAVLIPRPERCLEQLDRAGLSIQGTRDGVVHGPEDPADDRLQGVPVSGELQRRASPRRRWIHDRPHADRRSYVRRVPESRPRRYLEAGHGSPPGLEPAGPASSARSSVRL